MYVSGAKPKGRNLTPPEVTGEGAFVSGKATRAHFKSNHRDLWSKLSSSIG